MISLPETIPSGCPQDWLFPAVGVSAQQQVFSDLIQTATHSFSGLRGLCSNSFWSSLLPDCSLFIVILPLHPLHIHSFTNGSAVGTFAVPTEVTSGHSTEQLLVQSYSVNNGWMAECPPSAVSISLRRRDKTVQHSG
jgi:hypothetical protein